MKIFVKNLSSLRFSAKAKMYFLKFRADGAPSGEFRYERIPAATVEEAVAYVNERTPSNHLEPLELFTDSSLKEKVYTWASLDELIMEFEVEIGYFSLNGPSARSRSADQMTLLLKELKEFRKEFHRPKED